MTSSSTIGAKLLTLIFVLSSLNMKIDGQDVIGCGGFIKSNTEINYKIIKVKLLTKDGAVKYLSEASPVNGYYMIPIYNKGEYILQVNPPPGWSFEPNQVVLNVDGVSDPCSKNEDINFMFKGFGLSGKVVTLGDNKLNGPSGVKLNLISNKEVIDSTQSGPDGSYYFSNVMPDSYLIEAQHPSFKFTTNKVSVVLSKENWSAKDNIIISGFRIQGIVTTLDKSPIKDALIELYFEDKSYSSISTKNFECDSSSKSDLKICQTKTDENGKFTFGNVAFGKYKIKASLKKNNLEFGMQPEMQVVDLTKHQDVQVENPFILDSVTIKSQVVLSDKNKPMSTGEVYINDKKSTDAIKNGEFIFNKLTTGTYKIQIKSKNIYFEEKLIHIDLSSSECLKAESLQYKNILTFTKFVAKSFDVCGEIKMFKESQNNEVLKNDLIKYIQIKCYKSVQDDKEQNLKQIKATNIDSSFKYCLQLDSNVQYTLKAELSDNLSQILKLIPDEKKITVVDEPLFNVNFEQLEAKLEGKLRFLKSQQAPPDFIVVLKSTDSKRNWQQEIKLDCVKETVANSSKYECKFKLSNLLFGKYYLTTNYDGLFCWKKQDNQAEELIININSESQNVLIEQVGYKLNYELSHKNVILKITEENNQNSVLFSKNILKDSELKASICLPQAVNYNLIIESCHRFTQNTDQDRIVVESGLFKKNLNTIKLNSLKIQTTVDIVFKFEDINDKKHVNSDDLTVEVKSELTEQIELIKFKLKQEKNNEIIFTGKSWFKPNQILKLIAKSKKLLFETNTKELRVDEENCESNNVQFEAKLGIFLVGNIKPKDIDGIDLTIRSKVDNSIIHTSSINSLKGFRVGPLKSPTSLYKIELVKSGYLFSNGLSSELSTKDEFQIEFTAQKLGQLKVSVVISNSKNNLENALLSLSSEDRTYRQSLKSDQNGFASFDNLKPGLYYLIVMMQEYDFVPNSHPIQITDGYHMNLVIEAKRIAFSCFGRVTSINGQAENDIEVEAIGKQAIDKSSDEQNEICKSSRESSKVEQGLGTYRIFNLIPKCEYELKVKYIESENKLKNKYLKLLPETYKLKVENADIIDKNFIVLDQVDRLDLSVAVSYRPTGEGRHLPLNYKQVNNYVRIKLFKTNQPDSLLQTQFVPANSIAYFNSLPRINQIEQYSIQVELLLASTVSLFNSVNQQQQTQLQQQPVIQKTEISFYSDSAHKHLSVSFDMDINKNSNQAYDFRQQQYQNFYFTLPLFILVIGLLLNSNKVKQHLGNFITLIQQRGGLANFFKSLFNAKTTTSTTNNNQSKPTGRSAYMQQKNLNRDLFNDAEKVKVSPKQQKYTQVSSAQVTTANPTTINDNLNLDDYETVNIDEDLPELITLPTNTAIKRKAKKI